MLPPGTRLLQYLIVALRSGPGLGVIFDAEDTKAGRPAALRVLPAALADDAEWRARFFHDMRAIAALGHPGFAEVYEVGEALPTAPSAAETSAARGARPARESEETHPLPAVPSVLLFAATAPPRGRPLTELLAGGPLAAERALAIAAQIAAALGAAHARGLTHRDLTAASISIDDSDRATITDFGVVSGIAHDTPATESAALAAASSYSAPELVAGAGPDARSDVYALGAIVWEMLTGRPPRRSAASAAHQIPGVAPEIERLLLGCLARDRERRYASAREVHEELQRLSQPPPVAGAAPATAPAGPQPPRADGGREQKTSVLLVPVPPRAAGRGAAAPTVTPGSPAASSAVSAAAAASEAPGVRTLAILPFRSLRPDPATDFLGFSLADTIITRLDVVQSLVVRPSSFVERFAGQVADPESVGRELGVNTILSGTYLALGSQIRLNAQLVDLASRQILWKGAIAAPMDDLFGAQDRIAAEIIAGMRLPLTAAERERLQRDVPRNPQAFELFLRSRGLPSNVEATRAALELVDESLRLDPEFAPAWVERGARCNEMNVFGIGGRQFVEQSMEAARRALELNDALPSAYSLAANMAIDTGSVEDGIAELERALALRPNSPELHGMLAYGLRFAGCLEESVRAYRRAQALEGEAGERPRSIYNNALLYLGRYDEFLRHLGTLATPVLAFYRGFAEMHRGAKTLALRHFAVARELDPASQFGLLAEAYSLDLSGKREECGAAVAAIAGRRASGAAPDGEMDYKVAQLFARLGEVAPSLQSLAQAVHQGFFCEPYLTSDPLLEPLRDESAFQTLLLEAGERREQFRERYRELLEQQLS